MKKSFSDHMRSIAKEHERTLEMILLPEGKSIWDKVLELQKLNKYVIGWDEKLWLIYYFDKAHNIEDIPF